MGLQQWLQVVGKWLAVQGLVVTKMVGGPLVAHR